MAAAVPPPFLPARRPRRLTLSITNATQEELSGLLDNYGAFGSLPAELRRHILADALGRRTMHMGLTWDHPLLPVTARQQQQHAAAAAAKPVPRIPSRLRRLARKLTSKVFGEAAQRQQERRQEQEQQQKTALTSCHRRLDRDKTQAKTWQWHGSTCHRRDTFSKVEVRAWMGVFAYPGSRVTPDWDFDCAGVHCECDRWPEERRARECPPGVLGWLLSCRQAYADGIDVLYGTNAFHVNSRPLIQEFPRLLLPQRLAVVRSLELIWTVQGPAGSAVDAELLRLCETLPAVFPRLNKLYISLLHERGVPRGPAEGGEDDPVMAAERKLLGPVEAMLLRLDGRGELSVAVPPSFWKVLLLRHDQLRSPGLRAELDWPATSGRFWKQLNGEGGGDDGKGPGRGYWVCSGMDHDPGRLEMHSLEYWGMWRDGGPAPLSCPVVVSQSDECPFLEV